MKVMHVMAGATQGGAENIFLECALALADAPIEQAVVTRPENTFRIKSLEDKGIKVATASFNKLLKGPTKRVIAQMVAEFQPDIIQYWMGRAGIFAVEGDHVNVAWYGGYYKRERFTKCDYHVGLTQDLYDHIVAQGVPQERAKIIYTYAEFPDADPTPRASLDTPEDVPLLLSLARLHKKKAIDILLESLLQVPEAYLWIAGEGPIEAELKQQCTDLGLDNRVRFLGWRNDRGSLLAAADICVFPSRYEPFGTVTVDAWAAKTPLVAAKAAGPKAYVTHDHDGLLVEIDDVQGLADAINRVIHEDGLAEKLIAGGTQTYEGKFTKQVYIRDSLDFYKKILSEKS